MFSNKKKITLFKRQSNKEYSPQYLLSYKSKNFWRTPSLLAKNLASFTINGKPEGYQNFGVGQTFMALRMQIREIRPIYDLSLVENFKIL